jgi:hypothetical protein
MSLSPVPHCLPVVKLVANGSVMDDLHVLNHPGWPSWSAKNNRQARLGPISQG